MPMTSTERSRLWRQRQRDYIVIVRCEVDADMVSALIDAKLLAEDKAEDRNAIAEAMMRAARIHAAHFVRNLSGGANNTATRPPRPAEAAAYSIEP